MIIYKENKGFETRSDKPNENWTTNNEVFVVNDNSELAKKIVENYPYYDFVLNDVGNLIDVAPTERPIETKQLTTEEKVAILEQENADLLLDSVIKDIRIEQNELDIADLLLVVGGM